MAKPTRSPQDAPSLFLLMLQCVLCFQLAAVAIYYNGYFTNPLIHKMLLGQYLALLAWLLFAGHVIWTGKIVFTHSPFYLPGALLAGWALIRALTTQRADALDNVYVFLLMISAFPLWAYCFQERRFRSLFVWTMLFIGLVMMLGCLRQLFSSYPPFQWPYFDFITLGEGATERQSIGSFMGHNIQSGAVLAVSALFAVYLLTVAKRLWMLLFAAGYLLLALTLIFIGGSRGIVLMLIPAAALLVYAARGVLFRPSQSLDAITMRIPYKSIAAGFAILLVVFTVFAVRLAQLDKAQWEQSVVARFFAHPEDLYTGTYPRVWWLSLVMIRENPLTGVGFTGWPYVYPEYQSYWFNEHPTTNLGLPQLEAYPREAHNDWLQTWAELGLPGLFLMLWLTALFLRAAFQLAKRRAAPRTALFGAAAALAIFTHALVFFSFQVSTYACFFIACLALTSGAAYPRQWVYSPLWLRRAATGQTLALTLAAFALFLAAAHPISLFALGDYFTKLSHRYADTAYRAYLQGDFAASERFSAYGLPTLRRALEFNPRLGTNREALGKKLIQEGITNRDPARTREGVEELRRSLDSYSFYKSRVSLGDAYAWLWEQEQREEDLEAALAAYKKSVYITPTYEPGWVEILLLGTKSGADEAFDLAAELELRFPGFIERALLPAASESERSGADLDAMYLVSLASFTKPQSEVIFHEAILFYLRKQRPDLAASIFHETVEFHLGPERIEETKRLMSLLAWTMLTEGQPNQAHKFLLDVQIHETLAERADFWFARGLASWMVGDPWQAAICMNAAVERGLPTEQAAPFFEALRWHFLWR